VHRRRAVALHGDETTTLLGLRLCVYWVAEYYEPSSVWRSNAALRIWTKRRATIVARSGSI